MTPEQVDRAIVRATVCVATLPKQTPFVCWIESSVQIRGDPFAVVRTMSGKKITISIDFLSAIEDRQLGPED